MSITIGTHAFLASVFVMTQEVKLRMRMRIATLDVGRKPGNGKPYGMTAHFQPFGFI